MQLGNKGFGEPLTFDNTYYKTLETKPWAGPNPPEMAKMIGLPSDHVLPDGEQHRKGCPWPTAYCNAMAALIEMCRCYAAPTAATLRQCAFAGVAEGWRHSTCSGVPDFYDAA